MDVGLKGSPQLVIPKFHSEAGSSFCRHISGSPDNRVTILAVGRRHAKALARESLVSIGQAEPSKTRAASDNGMKHAAPNSVGKM